jgi:hypothetical protein
MHPANVHDADYACQLETHEAKSGLEQFGFHGIDAMGSGWESQVLDH